MAFSLAQVLGTGLILGTGLSLCPGPAPAVAQPAREAQDEASRPESLDLKLSPECRVPSAKLDIRAPLKRLASALEQKRPIKVLSLGPPSTGGLASGSSSATSAPRLQGLLEKVLAGSEVTLVQRGLPGEITAGATERIMNMVTEVGPDLVVWKVGTHDALARVEIEPFATALGEVLEWLDSNEVDVLLIQPPYVAAMAADEHYTRLLAAIGEVARSKDVPVVLRFEAGQFLSQQRTEAAQNQFRLFELGQHCVSEYVARAIEKSINPR